MLLMFDFMLLQEKREGRYLEWERIMDKWLCHNKILKKDELFYAVTTLTRSAYKFWFQKKVDLKVHKEPSITTWQELKVILRKKYAPKSTSPQIPQISDCEINSTTYTDKTEVSDLLHKAVSNNSHDMITHLY